MNIVEEKQKNLEILKVEWTVTLLTLVKRFLFTGSIVSTYVSYLSKLNNWFIF